MAVTRCPDCENAPRFLTVDEVAQLLRVSKMTVYRVIESGELKHSRIARNIRIDADDFNEYLRQSVVGA